MTQVHITSSCFSYHFCRPWHDSHIRINKYLKSLKAKGNVSLANQHVMTGRSDSSSQAGPDGCDVCIRTKASTSGPNSLLVAYSKPCSTPRLNRSALDSKQPLPQLLKGYGHKETILMAESSPHAPGTVPATSESHLKFHHRHPPHQ